MCSGSSTVRGRPNFVPLARDDARTDRRWLLPVGVLGSQGQLSGFGTAGLINATIAGGLGAAGAVCIIWAFKTGGLPIYVMPLVFGGAPIVNVAVGIMIHPPKAALNPMLFVGFLLASIGAGMVLYFRPTA